MSQRTCTRCAHTRSIVEFEGSNTTRLLSLCSRCRVLYSVALSWVMFTNYSKNTTAARRRPLGDIDPNTVLQPARQSKRVRTATAITLPASRPRLLPSTTLPSVSNPRTRRRTTAAPPPTLPSPLRPNPPPPPVVDTSMYLGLISNYISVRHDLGPCNDACTACGPVHWKSETVLGIVPFTTCCSKGDGLLDPLPEPPALLKSLLNDDTPRAKHFRRHIRAYNSALTFTSCMYTADTRLQGRGGIQTFTIHGELYHLQGPLHASAGSLPSFAQLYFLDPNHAATARLAQHPDLHQALLAELAQMMHDCNNPFISMYATAREQITAARASTEAMRIVINPRLQLIMENGSDKRRHNLPTANEVAVFIPDEYEDRSHRDIVIAERRVNGEEPRFHRISHTNAAYFPLHYVLFFPQGNPGWTWSLRLRNDHQNRQRVRYSQRAWLRYHLFKRPNQYSTVLRGCRLFQQYVVDSFAIVEQSTLEWHRRNQNTIRSEVLNGLQDALIHDDVNPDALGKRVVLPSSFTGGDRFMQQSFQDSMTIVRHFGKPSMFVTFTANPAWSEIVNELELGQTVEDRPDLVVRVFHAKKKALMQDLRTMFGRYVGTVWTIEYQKRGLPHTHILLFLHRDDGFLTRERVDDLICAELPDPALDADGALRAIIESTMVHGPCGASDPTAPCMVPAKRGPAKVCNKNFPKAFQEETEMTQDGYPLYRRRNDGRTFTRRKRGRDITFDNRWVVPYNPYLTRKYEAHINVELCSSVGAVKYIHKYVYKGDDRTTLRMQDDKDEIARYLNGRYVGPCQAAWEHFEFRNHDEDPPVVRLIVHLPNQQPVYFNENAISQDLRDLLDLSESTLTCFFRYNTEHADGRDYLYHEFPEHYVYHKKKSERRWTLRQRGRAIGRMYHCNPHQGERYYLRLLLTVVRGSRSFEDVRTVDEQVHSTFKAACLARRLLDDDGEWISCFTEAVQFSSGKALRSLFVTACTHEGIVDAPALWNRFRADICDDLPRRMVDFPAVPADFDEPHADYGLYLIAQELQNYGKTLADFELPLSTLLWVTDDTSLLIVAELDYDVFQEIALRDTKIAQLNTEQHDAFDTIVDAVTTRPEFAHFFLHDPAGTGKTFLYETLCHHYRAQGLIVLCVASTGIAAQLLPGGSTSHSRFKIPLICTDTTTCHIPAQSDSADLLRRTALIIWDEVPMQGKYNFTAVNFSLGDIRKSDELFGGIPLIMGGDFAQTTPIVPKGSRADQVNASIRSSWIWPQLTVLRLRQNMRVSADLDNTAFAEWIGRMSYNSSLYNRVQLPSMITNNYEDRHRFIERIFPLHQLAQAASTPDFFQSRAILCSRNDAVKDLNAQILKGMNGEIQIFSSIDKAVWDEGEELDDLSAEFLQTLEPNGFPVSQLSLKIGAPIMLLRNLHPNEGMCNGTRLTVTRLHRDCIEGRILGGAWNGERRLIPRIKLTSKEGDYPWILTRKQFPVRVCFAMTINKSQGQSLSIVGLDLSEPCFSHGQLYVALSRARDVQRLAVLYPSGADRYTVNVVYPEVLLLHS